MKIGIVGLGLIGGSLAHASTKAGHDVFGTDINEKHVKKALDTKAIKKEISIETMSTECDLVILCVPLKSAQELLETLLEGTAIITDVASVKSPICNYVASLSPEKSEKFIGGHPMAGSEQSGFDAAREDLFESKMWIIVPPADNSLKNVGIIEQFVSSFGMEHCLLDPEVHDEMVASISHLPHLASFALMNIASDRAKGNEILLRLAGGGFRDMTRIAASNSKMWLDIVQENKNEILKALDHYKNELENLMHDINDDKLDNLEKLFIKAGTARSSLPDAARRLDHLSEIHVPVPDRPGVLTEITALAADINIYDIKIVHSLEEDRGVLSLVVLPEQADELIEKLEEAGFVAGKSELSKADS